ncbi:MAG: GNAT family N-acetyltransferase [Roseiflexaceae bacterium]
MHTRIATLDDAAALAELITVFNIPYPGIPVTTAQATARLAACQGVETTILAEVDRQAVGFACLRLVPYMSGDEPYAELTDLFVAAGFRRRGVARALMAHVEQLAHAGGATDMILLTGHENAGAQAFYRALGYQDYSLALRRRIG